MQPNTEPNTLPTPDDVRKLAQGFRAAAMLSRQNREERDADKLEEQADACEREATHDEAHASESSLFELVLGSKSKAPRGSLYEVEREDASGFSELGFGSLGRMSGGELDAERIAQRMREGVLFVFVPDDSMGSDYGGSGAVSKSNAKALEELAEEHKLAEGFGFWTLSGAHSSYGVAFRLSLRCAELVRVLEGLADYPLIDEELHSETEVEEQGEAWSNLYASDFRRALESEHALDLEGVSDDSLFALFETARESANEYWTHESDGASIRLERILECVTRADALALEGAKRDADDVKAEDEALAQLRAACEPFAAFQLEALQPLRTGSKLEDCAESVRAALGSVNAERRLALESFLSQVARWPVSETAPAEDATAESLREALRVLRSHVGSVVRGAREELERFAPEYFARETERGAYRALPSETPKRD